MHNKIKHAINKIMRYDFLPKKLSNYANLDKPLPIGYGQTNSQPSLVFDMLAKLNLHKGQKVLDVGCGSGWTTALIADIIGPSGFVDGTEIIPELCLFAKHNIKKYKLSNLKIHQTKKQLGYKQHAPYDRILVSAHAHDIPKQLLAQLSPNNGRMIIPVNNELLIVDKHNHELTINKSYQVSFVPLIY